MKILVTSSFTIRSEDLEGSFKRKKSNQSHSLSLSRLTNKMAGAGGLANLYGTEKDRVNCPFYFKTGACRHGDKCTRLHNKPVTSQTLMLPHMYLNPIAAPVVNAQGMYVFDLFFFLFPVLVFGLLLLRQVYQFRDDKN